MHKQRFPCKLAELLRHARPESAPAPRRKYNDSRFLHIHFQKIELMSSDWLQCYFANLLKIFFQCQNSVVKTVSGARQDTDLPVTAYAGACGGVRGFKNHVERRPKAAEGFTISPFKEFLTFQNGFAFDLIRSAHTYKIKRNFVAKLPFMVSNRYNF